MSANVVVGAGLTGLSAVASMVYRGIQPIILEKSNFIGGLARSISFEGQTFDYGVHIFRWPSDRELRIFLRDHIKDLMSKNIRYALNVNGRKIFPQPEFVNFLRYPIQLKLSLLKNVLFSREKDMLLSSHLKNIYGDWMYSRFFKPYIEKKLPLLAVDNIHSDWWGMIKSRDEFNIFKSQASRNKSGRRLLSGNLMSQINNFLFGYKNAVYYHKEGIGEVANRLYSYLSSEKVEISFNTHVEKISETKSASLILNLSNGSEIRCDNLIWTGSLTDLTSLLGIGWPDSLTFLSTIFVFIVFEKRTWDVRKYLFEYCASKNIIFHRFYFNDYFCNNETRFGICAEISDSNKMNGLENKEILDRALDGLKLVGAINGEKVISSRILRVPGSHPVYPANYRDLLEKVFISLKKYPNIYPVGRNGSFNNISMPVSLEMGWKIGKYCYEN